MDWRVVYSRNIDWRLVQCVHQQLNDHLMDAYVSCRKKVGECTDLHHHQQTVDRVCPHSQATI